MNNLLNNKNTILTVALLLSFLGLYAQKPSDAQRVDVHFSEIELSLVLEEISKEFGVQFSYGNDHLNLGEKISFHSEGKPLMVTLGLLFDDYNIGYASIGNQLVLKQGSRKDQRRKERQQKKKKREDEREEREKQTLERGTMFNFDLHSEIVRPQESVEEEEEVTRKMVPTKEIKPLIAKTIEGDVVYEESLKLSTTDYVAPSKLKHYGAQFGQLSLMPFLSTNGQYLNKRNNVSFNFFWGINGGVNGLEIGLLGNSIKRNVNGLQVGGLFNMVNGHLYGTQVGGLFNISKGQVVGLQLGGLFNIGGDMYGTQLGGLTNVSRNMYGFQLSGLSNVATDVYGFQVSGLFNFANGKLFGSQIAGFGNVAWGGKSAVQFAGIFNASAKAQFQIACILNTAQEVDGAQIGAVNFANKTNGVQFGVINSTKHLKGMQVGIINIAQKAEGFMFGFINIVDSIKGFPLGFINIVKKNGYNRLELSGGDAMYLNFGAKFGAKHFYHILQVGWKIDEKNKYAWSAGVGFGAMIPISKKFHFNLELVSSHVNEGNIWTTKLNLLNQFKWTFDIKIKENVSLFLGPTANFQVSQLYNEETKEYGSNIMMYNLYNKTFSETNLKMWVGFTAGLRF